MADIEFSLGDLINTEELLSAFWGSLPPEILANINLGIKIGLALLVIWLIYISLLVVGKLFSIFFGSREARRLSEISSKLDNIADILSKKGKKDIKKSKF